MKIIKFLAYVGLASTAAYVAHIMSNISDKNSSRNSYALEGKPLKKESSNDNKYERKGDNSQSPSDSQTQMMYKNLGMTDEQKRQYEHDYHAITGNWKRDNPNYEMDDQQKTNHQSASLKSVLNEVQYAMYRDAIDSDNS